MERDRKEPGARGARRRRRERSERRHVSRTLTEQAPNEARHVASRSRRAGEGSEAPTDAPGVSPGTTTEPEAISGFPPWIPSACQTITATGERSLTSDSHFTGPGPCITIYAGQPVFWPNAEPITLNGNGHTIASRGGGTAVFFSPHTPPGTRRALSQRPVVIRDIDIQNVETGIAVGSVDRTTVEGTSIANATTGIQLEPTDGQASIDNAVVRHNRIGNVWAGIDVIRGNGATVQQNTVTAQGRGVRLFDSTGCTLADNAVSGTNENSGAAIGLSGEGGHTLVRNTAVGSQDGISMERCHGNTIARTAAIDNGGYGIRLRDCDSNVIEE